MVGATLTAALAPEACCPGRNPRQHARQKHNIRCLTAAALLVAAGDFVPVYDIPPGVEVIGAAILVLKVVGVFPDVVAHDGIVAVRERAVLVGSRCDLQLATRVKDEPCPAGAKAFDTRVVKGGLEGVERAESTLDGTGDGAGRLSAAVGLHDLPEHGMVDVAASVIADDGANALGHFIDTTHQFFKRQRCKLSLVF